MDELATFILARISEDERVAMTMHTRLRQARVLDPDVEEYFVVWHPKRVLAECESKRLIVELQRSDLRDDPEDWEADEVLRLLALPYADHPHYRPEWRP